jgi:hypothetical protein
MGVYQELLDLLVHLPAVDSPDERKALLTFTGFAEVGIYLDWQGNNVAFVERLLGELSRRGKGALVGFVEGLAHVPQVENNADRQEELAALRARVDGLDGAGFRAEFAVPVPAEVALPRPPADLAMLAAAAVNEVLVPYYRLGGDKLRQEAGKEALALAEAVAHKVEVAFDGEATSRSLLHLFARDPERWQAGLLGLLRVKLEGDPILAGELAELLRPAGAGRLQELVEVSQRIGLVRGEVVGAVVGAEVLKKIRNISALQGVTVRQDIGTVAGGGTVTGVYVGDLLVPSGAEPPPMAGSDVEEGVPPAPAPSPEPESPPAPSPEPEAEPPWAAELLKPETAPSPEPEPPLPPAPSAGPKASPPPGPPAGDWAPVPFGDVNTGGGAYIGGNAQVGGDLIGHDQVVHGDQVSGDKITVGEGSTVVINVGPEPEPERPWIEEAIRLDVATPPVATLNVAFYLAVAVRQPNAPPLAVEDLTQVRSEEGSIFRHEEEQIVAYRITVTAAGCDVEPPYYVLKLRPGTNSRPALFQITPHQEGKQSIVVTAYQEDEALAAQTRLTIEVHVPVTPGG